MKEKKYELIKYAMDCGVCQGMDYDTKKQAEEAVAALIREGWENVACYNRKLQRIEIVAFRDFPVNVLLWFREDLRPIIEANTKIEPKSWWA